MQKLGNKVLAEYNLLNRQKQLLTIREIGKDKNPEFDFQSTPEKKVPELILQKSWSL